MMDMKLPEVHGDRPLFDFLLNLEGNDSYYTVMQETLLNQTIKTNETIPTVYEI